MAVRIQLRRDTAANWVSANPTLRAGEIGIETDTLKFKVGNGTSTWTQITAYANVTPSSLTSSLGDYILAADQGTAGGPAELDSNGDLIIPENSIILWNDAAHDYTTTLTATEPTADRTITLKDGTGTLAFTSDIPSLSIAQVNTGGTATETYNNITTLQFDEDSGFDVTNPSTGVAKVAMNSTFKYWEVDGTQQLTATGLDTVNFISGTGIDITANGSSDPQSLTIAVDTTAIQAKVADVSDTEIGYLNGVTSAIQTQINNKQDVVSGVSSTEIGYLDGVTSGIQNQIDGKLALSGGTLTGALTLNGAPTSALHAATKQYVDNTTAGLNFHAPAHVATTANLTATYNNGTDGVGATLTGSGAFPEIDGHTAAEQERVLVKNQSTASQNGLYVLTDDGDPSGSWVLTRATDADNSPSGEIAYGDFVFIQNGGQAGYGYIVNTTGTITIGSTSINYIQFSAGQVVTAGNGLTEPSAGTIAIDTTITADLSTAQTLTNKRLTSPKINEDVALTATATELNILDGATLSTTELNYVDGVTSSIQTQLNNLSSKNTVKIVSTSNFDATYNNGVLTFDAPSALVIGGYTALVGDKILVKDQTDKTENGIYEVTTAGESGSYTADSSTGPITVISLPSNNYLAEMSYPYRALYVGDTVLTDRNYKLALSGSGPYSEEYDYNALISLGHAAQSTIYSCPLGGTSNGSGLCITAAVNTVLTRIVDFDTTPELAGSIFRSTYDGKIFVCTSNDRQSIGSQNIVFNEILDTTFTGSTGITTLGTVATGSWNGTAIGPTKGGTGLTSYTSGDILYASGSNTLAKLAKGTDGEILTLASGIPSWEPAPITLPSQSGEEGKYLTTDGTTASWATLVVPIETGTATVTANTATTVDTTALSTFTSIEYMVSLKQGSKIRTSKVLVQTDGTSVDMTEFGITETGGTISGVVVSAAVSSTNAVLQVTATDATSTNVTVKFSKVKL